MALTLYQAAKLSRNPLAKGVMSAIVTTDEMLAVLPMVSKMGESFIYNREKTLAGAAFVAPDHSSIAESSTTFDRVTVPLRLLVSDVDVYNFAEEQMGDTTAQKAMQLEKKLKSAGRTISNKAITGGWASAFTISPAIAGAVASTPGPLQDSDRHGPGSIKYDQAAGELSYRAPGDRAYGPVQSEVGDPTLRLLSDNPNRWIDVVVTTASLPVADAESLIYFTSATDEPDGLEKLVSAGQTILAAGTDGDALSFDKLDEMLDEKVKVRDGLHFVMNSKLKRKFFALVRGLGGTDPQHVTVPGITSPVPTYRGIPILQNDWIGNAESKGSGTTLSSAYLMSMSGEGGFFAGVGGSVAQIVEGDPRDVRVMGLKIRDIGELEAKEAMRTRISWYGAFGIGSDLAVARSSQLVTV